MGASRSSIAAMAGGWDARLTFRSPALRRAAGDADPLATPTRWRRRPARASLGATPVRRSIWAEWVPEAGEE